MSFVDGLYELQEIGIQVCCKLLSAPKHENVRARNYALLSISGWEAAEIAKNDPDDCRVVKVTDTAGRTWLI